MFERSIIVTMRGPLAFVATAVACLAEGVWERKADFPLLATEVSAATIHGKAYVVCGLTAQGSSNRLFVYDSRMDQWAERAPAPFEGGGDHCNVAASAGKLYLLGAIRIGSSFIDGNTYEYDPATDRWTTVATMPTPRAASGVAAIGSKIYVAGGLAANGSVANFDVFDAAIKHWTSLPPMPTARDHLTAQAVNGKMYAIAGRAAAVFSANEEFDPGTGAWTQRAPIPTPRGGLASGVLNNRIVVFGGEGPSGTPQGTFRQNEEYDPATDTWRPLADMPVPRHGFYGATLDGRILAASGGPVAGAFFSSFTDAFYLAPSLPPAISGVRDAAYGGTALSPGMLASLYGQRLSSGEQVASRLPLAFQMNATVVKVNGADVPLLYVGPSQVNFRLPQDLPLGPASVTAWNAGSESVAAQITVVEAAPAIFGVLIAGTGLSRPARQGEVIEIYATGFGRSAAIPTVSIGGQTAEVLFSGPAPTVPGLHQLNARIPVNTAAGASVPLRIELAGRISNTVMITIGP
jgi:uncharacterized protein (TIGR03437 family)